MQSYVFVHQFVNPNWPEVVNLFPGAPRASRYVWINCTKKTSSTGKRKRSRSLPSPAPSPLLRSRHLLRPPTSRPSSPVTPSPSITFHNKCNIISSKWNNLGQFSGLLMQQERSAVTTLASKAAGKRWELSFHHQKPHVGHLWQSSRKEMIHPQVASMYSMAKTVQI